MRPWSRALAGLLVVLPAIAGATAVSVFEGRLLRSPSGGVAQIAGGSLADAVQSGDLDKIFAFIASGQAANTPVAFRDRFLTGGREVMVSPMLIAIASNKDDAVMMLMSSGATLDAPGNKFAVCLARRLGHDGIARMLATYGGPAGSQNVCPDATADPSAPLVAFASSAP